MTIYIPIRTLEMLKKYQDVTTVISTKPALLDRWIKIEVPDDEEGEK